MNLFIDRQAAQSARLINRVGNRLYYLIPVLDRPDAIIVLRNGLDWTQLIGYVADCTIGWDTAQPGFAAEEMIGTKRTKVTIYRLLRSTRYMRTLSQQLAV